MAISRPSLMFFLILQRLHVNHDMELNLCHVAGVKLWISTSLLETITPIHFCYSGWKIISRKDEENFCLLSTYSIKVVSHRFRNLFRKAALLKICWALLLLWFSQGKQSLNGVNISNYSLPVMCITIITFTKSPEAIGLVNISAVAVILLMCNADKNTLWGIKIAHLLVLQ